MASVQIASCQQHVTSHLAFSRRHSRLLASDASGRLRTHRCDEEGSLGDAVATDCSLSAEFNTVLAAAAEVLDAFIVVQANADDCLVNIMDVSGRLLQSFRLSLRGVLCMDLFHNRSEMVLGQRTGKVTSYSLRRPSKPREGDAAGFQVYARMSYVLEAGVAPTQLRAQDLPETLLVLHSDGTVSCIDAATFDALWLVPPQAFFSPPKTIFADRLSSHFAVYCESADLSSKNRCSLEIWHVPHAFSCGDSARFNRRVVPLAEPVLSAEVESVGKGFGVCVCVVLDCGSCLFFRIPGNLDSLLLESSCSLPSAIISSDQLSADPIHFHRSSLSAVTSSLSVYIASGMGSVMVHLHSLTDDYSHPYGESRIRLAKEFARSLMSPSPSPRLGSDSSPITVFEPPESVDALPSHSWPANDVITDDLPLLPATEDLPLPLQNIDRKVSAEDESSSPHLFNIVGQYSSSGTSVLFAANPTAVITHRLQHDEENDWSVNYVTKLGLFHTPKPLRVKSCLLEPKYICFASRARKFAVLSVSNEIFLFSLEERQHLSLLSDEWRPLNDGGCASLLLADVEFVPYDNAAELLSSRKNRDSSKGKYDGCVLLLAGDEAGTLYYFLTDSRFDKCRSGSFSALGSAIQCILCTGDPTHSVVKVGVNTQGNSTFEVPGSAVVVMGRDGEVRVWSFKMVPSDTEDGDTDLLSMQCQFTISGIITSVMTACRKFEGGCIDPTCMSVIACAADGELTSFEIPGLVADKRTPTLATVTESLQSYRVHSAAITSVRVSVMEDSDIRILRVEEIHDPESFPVLLRGPERLTVGYTLDELRRLAQLSSLVSCSEDRSLVLWRFIIDSVGNKTFLMPYPQQR